MEPSQKNPDFETATAAASSQRHIDEFELIKQIGEGAFGYVYQARDKQSKEILAIKVLDKSHIVKNKKTKSVYREKDILNIFKTHPHVIRLECVF